MLSHNSRSTNVQEWKVIWVSIDNQMHFLDLILQRLSVVIWIFFSVVQMGEEYYYAKDYAKALKWVSFMIASFMCCLLTKTPCFMTME